MQELDRRIMLGAVGVAGIAALSRFAKAGPLDPPLGPVSPTGHTTDELYDRIARTERGVAEPRIPVGSLAAAPPYAITAPGSYYLTSDIPIINGQTAISIASANVTLDLRGFSVRAPNNSNGALALDASAAALNLVIRNGTFANTRILVACQLAMDACIIAGASGSSQVALISNGTLTLVRSLVSGISASAASILVAAGCGLVAETCTFRGVATGVDVSSGARAIVRNCEFDGAGSFGTRFLGGSTGAVMDSVFTNCATGCLNQSGAPVKFLRNVAFSNTQNYSGVSNVSTDPATAPPWANLSL